MLDHHPYCLGGFEALAGLLRLGVVTVGSVFCFSVIFGCIGALMADTGIEEILSASFGGVLKMLSGKKFPKNVKSF